MLLRECRPLEALLVQRVERLQRPRGLRVRRRLLISVRKQSAQPPTLGAVSPPSRPNSSKGRRPALRPAVSGRVEGLVGERGGGEGTGPAPTAPTWSARPRRRRASPRPWPDGARGGQWRGCGEGGGRGREKTEEKDGVGLLFINLELGWRRSTWAGLKREYIRVPKWIGTVGRVLGRGAGGRRLLQLAHCGAVLPQHARRLRHLSPPPRALRPQPEGRGSGLI